MKQIFKTILKFYKNKYILNLQIATLPEMCKHGGTCQSMKNKSATNKQQKREKEKIRKGMFM